jgi:choline dehydrogenase-like flavoprotein
MIWALRTLRDAFSSVGGYELIPGATTLPFDATNEQFTEYFKNTVQGFFHVVGTCKMGADSDPLAVVDSKFRVRGIDRLRVADASIMPIVVSAHTSVTTFMLGEKCAHDIKQTIY